jgi:hypothetical protein
MSRTFGILNNNLVIVPCGENENYIINISELYNDFIKDIAMNIKSRFFYNYSRYYPNDIEIRWNQRLDETINKLKKYYEPVVIMIANAYYGLIGDIESSYLKKIACLRIAEKYLIDRNLSVDSFNNMFMLYKREFAKIESIILRDLNWECMSAKVIMKLYNDIKDEYNIYRTKRKNKEKVDHISNMRIDYALERASDNVLYCR